ncbi:nitroreductase/quinone reductase family protein [Mycolicibacterium goodii]|uniref:nitroreductase/quinone reductase family protein n=1 Tax=Mycolicibacterium goodii TaxID=134601 RepID=UPI000C25E6B9|nr:nitroreductase/quinone reductase family protein [Mycolicibacterium goodii]PJK22987.1 nitroreductase family deazaflavin-dependent oxidoreductase [Mycolicibacterium goodii]
MTEVNDQVVEEFRANAGVVANAMGGHFKGVHLLLLRHTGRRTGRPYVTPLIYVADGDRYVIVGSNGGAHSEPAWVANVAAVEEVVIEVGAQTLTAKPTVLREGPEWDRLHAKAVEYWPDLVEYQTHTTRSFPLIVLEPVTYADSPSVYALIDNEP